MGKLPVIAVLVGVAVSACGGGGSAHAINGRLILRETNDGGRVDDPNWVVMAPYKEDSQGLALAGACKGIGGYADVRDGASVVVKDATGKIIGTDSLGTGYSAHLDSGNCAFKWRATVPDSDFYTVTVGHRGDVTYKRDELSSNAWVATTTLGP